MEESGPAGRRVSSGDPAELHRARQARGPQGDPAGHRRGGGRRRPRPLAARGRARLGAVPAQLPRARDGPPVRPRGRRAPARGRPAGRDRHRRPARQGHGVPAARDGDRRPALEGAGHRARRPRVHPPRAVGAPEQERDVVVQPQLLAAPRGVGRDVPEGLRVGAPRRRLRRHEPGVLGRPDRLVHGHTGPARRVVGAARRDPRGRVRGRRRAAGASAGSTRSPRHAAPAAATTCRASAT